MAVANQIIRPGSHSYGDKVALGPYIYNGIWYCLFNNINCWDSEVEPTEEYGSDIPCGFENIWRSNDEGVTWSIIDNKLDTAFGQVSSGLLGSHPVVRVGNSIYFVWVENTGLGNDRPIWLARFNLVDESWTTGFSNSGAVMENRFDLVPPYVLTNAYAANKSIIRGNFVYIFYLSDYDVNDRPEFSYIKYNTILGTWTSETTLLSSTAGQTRIPSRFLLDSTNKIHIIIIASIERYGGNPSPNDLHHFTLDSGDNISAVQTDIATNTWNHLSDWRVIDAYLGTAYDVERMAVLSHTDPVASITTPYIILSDGVGDSPSWSTLNLPSPPNPLFEFWSTYLFDNWVTHEGSVIIYENKVHVFISSYYIYYDDAVDDDRITGKIWHYQLDDPDTPTWTITEIWEGPLDFKLKGTIATIVEDRIGLFINGIKVGPDPIAQNRNFLFEWFFWLGEEPDLTIGDSFALSDSIQLRLDGGSPGGPIVLDKCPIHFIDSAYCVGFKDGQDGTEDPYACPPKFFEISKEQCP